MNKDGSDCELLVDSRVEQTVDTPGLIRYAKTDGLDPFQCFEKGPVQLLYVRQYEVFLPSKLDVKVLESFEIVPVTDLDSSTRELTAAFRRSVPMDL